MFRKFGIGTDIEDIERFRDLDGVVDKTFLSKIFTNKELSYCFSKENAAPHLAARFTGKEAIIKALSSVSQESLSFDKIEILNDEKGAPKVVLHDDNFDKLQTSLSLSHCDDKAVAFAVVMEV